MEETANGASEGKLTVRKFTDDDKAAILAELDACEVTSEIRAVYKKHKVQAGQVAKWREAPKKTRSKPSAKPVIGAGYVLQYLESLEERIEALEASRDSLVNHLSKALGKGAG